MIITTNIKISQFQSTNPQSAIVYRQSSAGKRRVQVAFCGNKLYAQNIFYFKGFDNLLVLLKQVHVT